MFIKRKTKSGTTAETINRKLTCVKFLQPSLEFINLHLEDSKEKKPQKNIHWSGAAAKVPPQCS